jgi:hypothetical protein
MVLLEAKWGPGRGDDLADDVRDVVGTDETPRDGGGRTVEMQWRA